MLTSQGGVPAAGAAGGRGAGRDVRGAAQQPAGGRVRAVRARRRPQRRARAAAAGAVPGARRGPAPQR